MTIIPNYFLTGILAILVSTILIIWGIVFIETKHGGLIFTLLSFFMMLVGGGLAGPILIGIIIGLAGTKMNSSSVWMREHISSKKFLSQIWRYSYIVSVFS